MPHDPDTQIGRGGGPTFPDTPWSRILRAGKSREPTPDIRLDWERLACAYWRPVYLHLRRKGGLASEDAKDLTQAFFLHLMTTGFLGKADPERGRFRSFLRTSAENYLRDHWKAGQRLCRGGGRAVLSLDTLQVREVEDLAARNAEAEDPFDCEWRRGILAEALARLQAAYEAEGKAGYFEVLKRQDLVDEADAPSYADLAGELGISVTDVRNHLHHARVRLRRLVTERVLEYADDEADVETELRELF